ncbi:class I SAM-dependent methyltransferase [Rhodocaloribacter litoris]|uniref:class I SAM-dependent methyltransferase n=1 Tax=Rhodocaloribacter litoris TaxID=2558931 RepID=UPI00141DC2B2|nr:class I SAM-dependent methyltransferase [Rhodocaloribacter litoris]QXD16752.1 class I SAM-dependent methyltransferase [Rhodocaloribacter litoris]GIV59249.1 MAG: methyltransferase [Rhodothermaceae bacterium]
MSWYREWFDRDEYELVYRQRDDREAERVVDLIERIVRPTPGAAILDVGCGRGRHARSLARRGYRVTGIDLSERALEQARRRAAEEGLPVTFERGDMRLPACDRCFDGVVNLFTAFGYFDDDADHARALGAMATALRPGGWLVQDFLNASFVRRHLIPEDVRHENGLLIRQRRWIDDGRINKQIELHQNGCTLTFCESVRLLTLDDFRRLYDEAGLDLLDTFGDYDGSPHHEDAPRLILYARKRSAPDDGVTTTP